MIEAGLRVGDRIIVERDSKLDRPRCYPARGVTHPGREVLRLWWWQWRLGVYGLWIVEEMAPAKQRAEIRDEIEARGLPDTVDWCQLEIEWMRGLLRGWGYRPQQYQRIAGSKVIETPSGRKARVPVYDEQRIGNQEPDWGTWSAS